MRNLEFFILCTKLSGFCEDTGHLIKRDNFRRFGHEIAGF